jgi:hypothetical protein
LSAAKANVAKALARPDMAPIEQEYQQISKQRRNPAWYSLFGGPKNVLNSLLEDTDRFLGPRGIGLVHVDSSLMLFDPRFPNPWLSDEAR